MCFAQYNIQLRLTLNSLDRAFIQLFWRYYAVLPNQRMYGELGKVFANITHPAFFWIPCMKRRTQAHT